MSGKAAPGGWKPFYNYFLYPSDDDCCEGETHERKTIEYD